VIFIWGTAAENVKEAFFARNLYGFPNLSCKNPNCQSLDSCNHWAMTSALHLKAGLPHAFTLARLTRILLARL